MANVDAPFGLRPVRHIDGTPWNGATMRCYCSSNYAVALYIGDPVLWTPTVGDIDATCRYPSLNVSAGTSGIIVRGVITSFEPRPQDLTQQYRPVSQERFANVCIATPTLVFQIRDDGDRVPVADWAGENAIIAAGSGSTVTGLSGYELDGSTDPTDTQAHTLHILGLADIADNEFGVHAIWDVILNTSQNATGTYLGVAAA